uniref:Checkpoint protein n=1 Tax=Chromera velia CCMP2878 TaxID=1169474 RepID=A0A0G4HP60_9ALVE|eukprot:Cvel_29684.t1-p1 / transcript=Cvel_29684.t1 / gene=Cvel_29684 / organism=Chromera_velia_CCMP2878 / gene_product=hypothetical protein / transcript_product=hypothetical protein / location=Cvel_scaffold4107:3051-7890(-) / protein_length=328 / sequence_SO=supercontig / SO=protein_coding / is_pseudo=false
MFEKKTSRFLVRMCPSDFAMTIRGQEEGADFLCWCQIPMKRLCETVLIESKRHDIIGVSIELEHLANALRYASAGEVTMLRLAKKDGVPVLCFEIRLAHPDSANDVAMIITHQCFVEILPGEEAESLTTPGLEGLKEWRFFLPNFRQVKSCVERLRIAGGEEIVLEIHKEGGGDSTNATLKLSMETPDVNLVATFANADLLVDDDDEPPGPQAAAGNEAGARQRRGRRSGQTFFKAKAVSTLMHSASLVSDRVVFCLVPQRLLVLYTFHEEVDGYLVEYLPACEHAVEGGGNEEGKPPSPSRENAGDGDHGGQRESDEGDRDVQMGEG